MRAKLPQGYQLWPSFWMLPEKTSNCKYEEIDVVEYNAGRNPTFAPIIFGSAFYGSGPKKSQLVQRTGTKELKDQNIQDFSEQFHEYSIMWTENYIEWKLDGETYFGVSTQLDYWYENDRMIGTFMERTFTENDSYGKALSVKHRSLLKFSL